MKKFYFLAVLGLVGPLLMGQNIRFSWDITQNSSTSYDLNFYAATTAGTESMAGLSIYWYYNSSEVTVSSTDGTPLETTSGWGTGSRTIVTAQSDSRTVDGNAYTTRYNYTNSDGVDFDGISISTTPTKILTVTVSNATGTSGTSGNSALAGASDVSGLQYTKPDFSTHNIIITGTQTQQPQEVTSTYTGSWNNGSPENLRTFDHINVSSGSYTTTGAISVNNIDIQPTATLNTGSNAITVNGTATIHASASGYGMLLGDNAITATVEQYVGTSAGWRHLGFPTTGTFAQLNLDGAPKNYDGATGNSENLYTFSNSTFQYVAVTGDTYDPGLNGVTAWVGGAGSFATSGTISWTGTTGAGAQSINYEFSSSPVGDANYDGWNFFANPYPSEIDWQSVDNQDGGTVFVTYYIWDPQNSRWDHYDASGGAEFNLTRYIAPGQGFWVKSSGNGGTAFDLSNTDRTNAGGGNDFMGDFKTSSNGPRVRLTIANPQGYIDRASITFNPSSNTALDHLDAHRPLNGKHVPTFYSMTSDNVKAWKNAYGQYDPLNKIPLHYEQQDAQNGETFTISLNLQEFDSNWDLYIEDHFTGTMHDLENGGDFSFIHSDLVRGNRFTLHFSRPVGIDENIFSDMYAYAEGQSVFVKRLNPASSLDVEIVNLMGQMVYSGEWGDEGLIEIPLSVATGTYLVKVKDSDNNGLVKKVILQ